MPSTVQVSTPSRLHFGLLRFAQSGGLSFGGIGMMVGSPKVVVKVSPASQWSAGGSVAQARPGMGTPCNDPVSTQLSATATHPGPRFPSAHTGMGTGTQLALAMATAVRAVCDLPDLAPMELASVMGRGQRSAIGTYGFYYGGLILETGQDMAGNLGKLQRRVALPSDWQIVLITPPAEQGCHGDVEADAFGQLGTIPQATTDRLLELATSQIIPAAERNDPAAFDQAVYQYGLLAGKCFTPVQGGPFASEATTRRVAILRHLGIHGVGQSSWGPTLFALVRDDSPGALIAELTAMPEFIGCDFLVTSPDNRGAAMTISTGR